MWGNVARRAEILKFIRDNEIKNVIFLTADAHAKMMDRVSVDRFNDQDPVAYEFVSGSIGTNTLARTVRERVGVDEDVLNQALDLVEMRRWDLDRFGYGVVDVEASAGMATVTLKDEDGAVNLSKGASGAPRTITFGP